MGQAGTSCYEILAWVSHLVFDLLRLRGIPGPGTENHLGCQRKCVCVVGRGGGEGSGRRRNRQRRRGRALSLGWLPQKAPSTEPNSVAATHGRECLLEARLDAFLGSSRLIPRGARLARFELMRREHGTRVSAGNGGKTPQNLRRKWALLWCAVSHHVKSIPRRFMEQTLEQTSTRPRVPEASTSKCPTCI